MPFQTYKTAPSDKLADELFDLAMMTKVLATGFADSDEAKDDDARLGYQQLANRISGALVDMHQVVGDRLKDRAATVAPIAPATAPRERGNVFSPPPGLGPIDWTGSIFEGTPVAVPDHNAPELVHPEGFVPHEPSVVELATTRDAALHGYFFGWLAGQTIGEPVGPAVNAMTRRAVELRDEMDGRHPLGADGAPQLTMDDACFEWAERMCEQVAGTSTEALPAAPKRRRGRKAA